MLHRSTCAGVLVAGIWLVSTASAQVLYDGAAGGSPQSQPWLTYQSLSGTHYSSSGGSTTLDTTSDNSIQVGWHNHNAFLTAPKNAAFPSLDRSVGFTVTIDLRMIAESHTSTHRAGLSVLALAHDRRGIELSFWSNELWVQSGPNHLNLSEPLFTHAEGVAHNTATASQQRYALTILGDVYSVSADGVPILSGPVRDYTSWEPPPLAPDVYEVPNLLSFSDNTTSASAAVEFSYIAIPEPAGVGLLVCVAMMCRRTRRI